MNVNKLKGLMAENNDTQYDLAIYLNISPNSLRNKLKGKSDFKSTEIVKICNKYNVEPNYFFQKN